MDIVTSEQAQTLSKESDLLLLGFKAPWCPQCGPQRGVVERIHGRYAGKLDVAYIDLEASPEAQELFDIAGLPALIFYKGGEEINRLSGFTAAPKLNGLVAQLLA